MLDDRQKGTYCIYLIYQPEVEQRPACANTLFTDSFSAGDDMQSLHKSKICWKK